jgi:hypothetical protein
MWFIFHWLEINGRSKLQPFPYTHEGFQAGNLREITPKRQNLRYHSRRSSLNHWFSAVLSVPHSQQSFAASPDLLQLGNPGFDFLNSWALRSCFFSKS